MYRFLPLVVLMFLTACAQKSQPDTAKTADAPVEADAPPSSGTDDTETPKPQENEQPKVETPKAETPAPAPAVKPYVRTFEKDKADSEPSDLFLVAGVWTVANFQDKNVLKLAPTPLDLYQVIFNERTDDDMPLKVGGYEASVRVYAESKGRMKPSMGVGLGGISGYVLRLKPSARRLEILYEDKPVAMEDFRWSSGAWVTLKVAVVKKGDGWQVQGKAWADGEEEPAKPLITHDVEGELPDGDPSIMGYPMSGKTMYYDALTVKPVPAK